MKRQFGEYTRLAKGVFGCSSLWAGEEHLLYVRGTGIIWPFSETYRRVRYQDITALTAAPTPRSAIWISVAAAWVLLFGGIGAAFIFGTFSDSSDDQVALLAVFGTLVLPGIAVLIYNLARGKSCVYAIETASGILKIRAANRLKTARQVSPKIAERIGSQGS